MSEVELPYFDQVIDQLSNGDEGYEKAWGRHVHWGYWKAPELADGSVDDFAIAADEFCYLHHEVAKVCSGQSVLDVGCGFGGNIDLINCKYENMQLTGLNIDSRQIARAKDEVLPNQRESNSISFDVGNAVSLPYDDGQFDVVFALECIFHFPNRDDFIKEAYRVLKPGGRLVFSDFVGSKFVMPLLKIGYAITKSDTMKTLGHVLPFESTLGYENLAKENGFNFEVQVDISKNILPSIPVYKMLLDTGGEFVGDMFQTQQRVSDSMKYGLVNFVIISFVKS